MGQRAQKFLRDSIAWSIGSSITVVAFRAVAMARLRDPYLPAAVAVWALLPVWGVDDLVQGVGLSIRRTGEARSHPVGTHDLIRGLALLGVWAAVSVAGAAMLLGVLGGRANFWILGLALAIGLSGACSHHLVLRLRYREPGEDPPCPSDLTDRRERASVFRRSLQRLRTVTEEGGFPPFAVVLHGVVWSLQALGVAVVIYPLVVVTGVRLEAQQCQHFTTWLRSVCERVADGSGVQEPEVGGRVEFRSGQGDAGDHGLRSEPTTATTTTTTPPSSEGCEDTLYSSVVRYAPEVLRLRTSVKVALLRARRAVPDSVAGCLNERSEVLQVGPDAWTVSLWGGESDPYLVAAFATPDGIKAAQIFDRYYRPFEEAVPAGGGIAFIGARWNSGAGTVQLFGSSNGECRAAFDTPWRQGEGAVMLSAAATQAIVAYALHGFPADQTSLHQSATDPADGSVPETMQAVHPGYIHSIDPEVPFGEGLTRRRVGLSLPGDTFERVSVYLYQPLDSTADDWAEVRTSPRLDDGGGSQRVGPLGSPCSDLDGAYGEVAQEACKANSTTEAINCEVFSDAGESAGTPFTEAE